MLDIRNMRKAFGDLQVLKGIDLDVNSAMWSPFWSLAAAEKPRCCAA